MKFRQIIPIVCLGLAVTVASASAAVFSVPAPTDGFSAIQTVADRQMEVAVKDAHLREKPTTHSAKLATLKRGTKVDVIELVDNNKWAHVKVAGKTGYISANLLK
jgi:uncharacterized protein YgiM (DUF1202 family)